MIAFVDTSAFFAILDEDDQDHSRAQETWRRLLREGHLLLTTNYVLVETSALLQRRLGIAALQTFHEKIVPPLQVDWIGADRHQSSVEAALTAARKNLSVVDCISFETMRREGVQTVFSFDRHFREQGFEVLP
ncbi:MAG TPA: PIN domain-containing protein [Bryobacteraceae bacterium]|jgi:predicted nucleic acid-binding protein